MSTFSSDASMSILFTVNEASGFGVSVFAGCGSDVSEVFEASVFAGSAGSGCSADSAGCSVSGSGFCSGVNVPFSSPISQSSTETEGFGA